MEQSEASSPLQVTFVVLMVGKSERMRVSNSCVRTTIYTVAIVCIQLMCMYKCGHGVIDIEMWNLSGWMVH